MKITIEATDSEDDCEFGKRVIIQQARDDLNTDEVLEDLIKPALMGWGYFPETVEKLNYSMDEN